MKTFLKIATVLVLVLVAALPLCIGFGLEYGFNLVLRAMQTNSGLAIGSSRFERGYLSSKFYVELKPLLDGEPQSLTVEVQFQHGPLFAGPSLQFGLFGMAGQIKSAAITPQLEVVSLDEPMYSWIGNISAMGNGTFTDSYNPFTLRLKQGRLQWSRGEGNGRLNLGLKRIDYEGHLSQLTWQSPDGLVNLADADIAKQITLTSSGFTWFSRAAFKALNAQWGDEHYWLKNGALGVSRSDDGSNERWQLSVVAEEFKSKSWQLTVLDANLALDQVPAGWVKALTTLILSPVTETTFQQQAFELSRQYLQSSPTTALLVERFGALKEGKSFWLSGRADVAHLLVLPQEAWQSPQILLSQLIGSGEIHLEKSLLGDWVQAYLTAQNVNGHEQNFSPAQIDLFTKAFLGQGMLTDEGTMYACKVAFKSGDVVLNDKPMALPF